ncbi:SDR family NAD(P)-dependent oxidoreductase, partial [bacterium]
LELDLDMEADLGIDTVKQAELIGIIRDTYNIAKSENLSLKDYPTLRHVVKFVMGGGTAQPAAGETAPAETAKPEPAPARANGGSTPAPAPAQASPGPMRDEAAVTREVVAMVTEKTGYPAEMLELDLDMEADLGIDTVKQAELIGIIRDKYDIPKSENLSLKDYPTLRHVIRFVMAGGGSAPAPLPNPLPQAGEGRVRVDVPEDEAPRPQAAAAPAADERFSTWALEAYDRPATAGTPKLDKAAPVLVLAADPEQAKPFVDAVAAAGGEAMAVKTDWPALEKAEAVLRKALKDRPCGGLIDVTALADFAAEAGAQAPAEFDKAYRRGPRSLFLAAKTLAKDLAAPGAFAVVVTKAGGDHGCTPTVEFAPLAGAMTGLAKALAREIPSLTVRAVDFDPSAEPAYMAQQALAETVSSDPRLEVGWQNGVRRALRLARRVSPAEAPRKVTSRSVVLITGGGQGLGAELAKELAKRSKCALVLLGRTPLEKQAASWVRMSAEELAAMKQRMWEDLKKDKTVKATPALLEREFSKVKKACDLHRSIEAMSLLGSKVMYLQADMADGASVAKAVKAALKAHNRVDYVVHAAGLEESKLLADKKVEDFDRVYRAKAHGAFNLLKSIPPVRGQRWAFFSSVVGRFGNVGQADYAAASDFLAKLSASMNSKRRGAGGLYPTPAVTFDLTAFAEIGMATRGSVEAFLKSQGVDFMPPAEGVRLMLDVMLGDADAHEVLVAGALGKLDAEGLIAAAGETAKPAPEPARANGGSTPAPAPAQASPSPMRDEAEVTKEILALVTEKTGYPPEMLELDLDMEADLGIDTVKQAELIGMIRDNYNIAKSENLSLKDYPTLRHVIGFVMAGGSSGAPHPSPLPQAGEGAKAPALPLPSSGEGGVRVEGPKDLGALSDAPLFDTVLSTNGDGTKTGKTFSLESDPWLKDHAISGTPYVAGVMGLELFVETAAKKLGKAPAALADVHFALPIKLLRQRPITVRTVSGDAPEMRIESDFVSPQGIKLGAPRTHFTARVDESAAHGDVAARAQAYVKTLKADKPVVPAKAVYEAYFHGPRFQVLAGILAVGETELVGLYRAPAEPLWDKGGRALMFQPMLIEAAFQTCGYRDLHVRKKMTLPDSIESVRVYDAAKAPKELLVYARWRGPVDGGDGADRSLYDACVLGRDGKVWATLTGYRMIAVS